MIGLSQRANHPIQQLHLLHGNLFRVKCSSYKCDYSRDDYTDPIVPSLAIPRTSNPSSNDKTGQEASKSITKALEEKQTETEEQEEEEDISNESTPLPSIKAKDLPHCPKCNHLLRPDIVWFGEQLPKNSIQAVNNWIWNQNSPIDLILVIGTSAKVYPAAGYVDIARKLGAKVAVVNMDPNDIPFGVGSLNKRENGWFFQGEAGVVVPNILRGVIGDL